jgi:iron complex outermembrane receptor protein
LTKIFSIINMRFIPVLTWCSLSVFCALKISGQYIFKGNVLGGMDNKPLQGATVIFGKNVVAVTDSNGVFAFDSPTEKASVAFSHSGYQQVSGTYAARQDLVIILYPQNTLLSEMIVKAFERNTELKNIPATVTLLGKKDLERYSNTSVLPAVNTVPGVKMDERSPGSYRLSIRGNLLRSPFGVRNVKVYWNGIPFTDANGNTYLNQLSYGNVGKIEIIKGPGGSMYGAGTGGVVLLSSPATGLKENSISLNTLAGSYGLAEMSMAYRKESDNTNYTLQYTHQQSDGWRDHTNTRKDVANYRGNFYVNTKQSVSTNIFYSDLYYQTPGGLTQAQLAANPRQARPASGSARSAEQQQAALYIKLFMLDLHIIINLMNAGSIAPMCILPPPGSRILPYSITNGRQNRGLAAERLRNTSRKICRFILVANTSMDLLQAVHMATSRVYRIPCNMMMR